MHTWQGRLHESLGHGTLCPQLTAHPYHRCSAALRGAALAVEWSGVYCCGHAYCEHSLFCERCLWADETATAIATVRLRRQSQQCVQCVQLFDRHRRVSPTRSVGSSLTTHSRGRLQRTHSLTHSLAAQMWAHIMPQRHAVSCRRRPQCDATHSLSTDCPPNGFSDCTVATAARTHQARTVQRRRQRPSRRGSRA